MQNTLLSRLGLMRPLLLAALSTAPLLAWAAAPQVDSIFPLAGKEGDQITIYGDNLQGATIMINGSQATVLATDPNGHTLTVEVPSLMIFGSNPISVTASGSTVTSGQAFEAAPPVRITGLPTQAGVGETVTIQGDGFYYYDAGGTPHDLVENVYFGNVPAVRSTIDVQENGSIFPFSDQLTVKVPVGAPSTPTAVTVVTRVDQNTSTTLFTAIAAPVITDFCPKVIGPGTDVIISGANFVAPHGGTVRVQFSGLPEQVATVISPTELHVLFNTPLTSYLAGHVTVKAAGGTKASGATFKAYPAPVVTSRYPPTAAVGQQVTVNGRYFFGAPTCATTLPLAVTVEFATAGGPVIVGADMVNSVGTQLKVTVPPGATGTFRVLAVGGASATMSFTVGMRPAVEVAEATEQQESRRQGSHGQLTAWPNPAHDVVTVAVPADGVAAVVLRDAQGVVARKVAPVAGAAQVKVEGLKAGLYVIQWAGQSLRLVVE